MELRSEYVRGIEFGRERWKEGENGRGEEGGNREDGKGQKCGAQAPLIGLHCERHFINS